VAVELSVLIPVYNWDVAPLFTALIAEIESCDDEGRIEFRIADDCSSDRALRENNELFFAGIHKPHIHFLPLDHNIGRAAIRNLLAGEALGEYLLFLDGDVLPDGKQFLRKYLEMCKQAPALVCGGISYQTRILDASKYDFHVYFGNRKEVAPVHLRNLSPAKYVLTSNVMIRREIFNAFPFDESFQGYGYEDTEWAARLGRNHRIIHIDNSVSHLGLNDKATFYNKIIDSIPNYLLLKRKYPEIFNSSQVGCVANKLRYSPVCLLKIGHGLFEKIFKYDLIQGYGAFVTMQLSFACKLALQMNVGIRGEEEGSLND